MKNLTNLFFSLALALITNQVLAQDTQPENEPAELSPEHSVEDARYGYRAPNESVNSSASGCWSDYLRQLYLEDADNSGTDLLATRDPE